MDQKKLQETDYKYGWSSDYESETFEQGLNEAVIRKISSLKNEPKWLLEWRLKAFEIWKEMPMPHWAELKIDPIDFDKISYFSRPKKRPKDLSEVDPEIIKDFEKLGIPLEEQKWLAGVAVDAVLDSESLGTTHKQELLDQGIIFCSISEAVQTYPELVQEYLGSVVPARDNFYSCLNAAVFTDGSFVYIPKGVRCPLELSTYFRINEANTGQFERTLIIADQDSYVSYLEGCTAPKRDENQLHAAVVELVTLDRAEIKYSTVQNWYPGDENGKGGIYNFVTKRGICKGVKSKISWTQVETGSALTWKYPSCILKGEGSVGEFYSVAITKGVQQADTGTKMIHIGANTSSTIISKGISLDRSKNTYRGLVRINPGATGARNFTQCDSMIVGDYGIANTIPYIEVKNNDSVIEHEATTGRISEKQLYYLAQRGMDKEQAASTIVNGFCREVFKTLPLEFAAEAQKLLSIKIEGSIG
jgi:Fe-S cluster assembly protein SufB